MSEDRHRLAEATPGTVHVSLGSAGVLGLAACRAAVAPTTAYLMTGGRCAHNCAFCAQARSSTASDDQLSRVTWPSFPTEQVLSRLAVAYEQGALQRCCLQVTSGPELEQVRAMVRAIRRVTAVPLCISIRVTGLAPLEELLELGAERVTLAADAVCERVYRQVKGPDWQRMLDLLTSAARQHPGRVGTHVIIGLGETEAEAAAFLQQMQDLGITVGLFAFTPVRGTALASAPPPPLASYRRMQAALHLIRNEYAHAGQFRYTPEGRIISYGLDAATLRRLLAAGEAFRTAGCTGCNRPYYNERPGGPLYNYPRPLRPEEAEAAVGLVLEGLEA